MLQDRKGQGFSLLIIERESSASQSTSWHCEQCSAVHVGRGVIMACLRRAGAAR